MSPTASRRTFTVSLELSILEQASFPLAVQVPDEDVGVVLVHLEQRDPALGAVPDAGAGEPDQGAT